VFRNRITVAAEAVREETTGTLFLRRCIARHENRNGRRGGRIGIRNRLARDRERSETSVIAGKRQRRRFQSGALRDLLRVNGEGVYGKNRQNYYEQYFFIAVSPFLFQTLNEKSVVEDLFLNCFSPKITYFVRSDDRRSVE
jgi:hypothetical protein